MKLLLVDTFNLLHRAYHALPKTFTDAKGEPTNAVYGVTSMIISIFQLVKPTHVVAALDGQKPTFRLEEFTQYKAHRSEMDPDLAIQIPKVYEIIDAFGIHKIVIEGYEADDIIGTMASKYGNGNNEVIVVSNDRDLWQLINKNVMVMIPTTAGQAEWIGEAEVIKRMGFNPNLIPDYKGLRGDPSDNIPGVHGIGEKTAQKLLQEFGSMENIFANIEKVEPHGVRNKLENSYEIALTSKKLATIIKDVPMSTDINECKFNGFDNNQVHEILLKYNFKSLAKRLGFSEKVNEAPNALQKGLF